jgi:hypothetical protein
MDVARRSAPFLGSTAKQGTIMNRRVAVVFGVVVVAGPATANGQEQFSQPPGADQVTAPGFVSGRDDQQSRRLFTLDGLDVHVWAPLEPHYSAEANRNLAEQTIWDAE